MLRYFSLMSKNCWRNRRRTALTLTSVAVSFCLLGILLEMYRVLFLDSQTNPAQALRLVTHHKVSIAQPLPISFSAQIKRLPGVREVMVWQWFGGTYKDARDPRNFFARFAVEPEKLFAILGELEIPKDQQLAFQRLQTGCVVGRQLADKFQWQTGDRITVVGDIYPVNLELTIVGIYNDPDGSETLFFNYKYLRELFINLGWGAAADWVGVLLVQAQSPEAAATVATAIDREFENSPAPTKTEAERLWQLSFISFLGELKKFLLAMSAALTFTVVLVSANTISMSVRERVREIAMMKVLGFTRAAILGTILGESALVSLLGGIGGLLLAGGTCLLIRNSVLELAGLKLNLTLEVALAVLGVSVMVGLASSMVPAFRAANDSILDSLRAVE